jgi:TRAP-type mannitol/chloroaromatic compound transport system substrate-binding protein
VSPAFYSCTKGIDWATLYPSPTAGLYEFCAQISTTVAAATGGIVQVEYQFYSDGHSQAPGPAQATTTTQWSQGGSCNSYYVDAGKPIQWKIYFASPPTGSPSFRYALTLKQLQ